MIRTLISDSIDAMHAHREQIRELTKKALAPSFYCSYEFIHAHLANFSNHRRKYYFYYVGNDLVGFAVVANRAGYEDVYEFAGQKFLGYTGILASESERISVIRIFIDQILSDSDISVFDAGPLREGTVGDYIDVLNSFVGVRAKMYQMPGCPFIRTSIDFSEWKKSLKKAAYKDSIRAERRLSEMGSVNVFAISNNAPANQIELAVDMFIELHKKRRHDSWFGDNDRNINPKSMREFYIMLAIESAKADTLELSFLSLNGLPIAAHYGFVQNHWRYYFTPAYDPQYEKVSPGKILLRRLIEASFSNKDIFDFQNDVDPYKMDWTTDVAARYLIRIAKNDKYLLE